MFYIISVPYASVEKVMQQFGTADNPERVFVQTCLLMAQEEAYGAMPISRVPELYAAIVAKKYLMLVEDGDIQAIVLWQSVDESLARQLTADRRMPRADEISETGTAFALTALVGRTPRAVGRLMRVFFRKFDDHVVLYERHFHQKTKEKIKLFRSRGA